MLVILICISSLFSGLQILHQKEGLITEAECVKCSEYYGRCKVMAQILPAKSISESLKICEICEQYQLLYDDDMKLFKGVSVCGLCVNYFKFVL